MSRTHALFFVAAVAAILLFGGQSERPSTVLAAIQTGASR